MGYKIPDTKKAFKKLVKDNVVIFYFKRKTSEGTRKMVGTLSPDRIPNIHAPKGTGSFDHEYVIPIFDIEIEQWRSFDVRYILHIANIIDIAKVQDEKYNLLVELYSYEGKRSKNKYRVRKIKDRLEELGLLIDKLENKNEDDD
jgi:predicted TIM-barrel fold metal-dependent hydrolase